MSPSGSHVAIILLPLMAVVLIGFLIVGLALPVLPLHVYQDLGLSAFVVGIVAGSQFAASFFSRIWSGHYADTRGPKRAVVIGLLSATAAGLLYLVSLRFADQPVLSVTILIVGRAVLGGAESFIITGALSWGLGLVDAKNIGKVIAWIGTAMYAAFALGAPVGSFLYAAHGFASIALATTLCPLVTLLLILPMRPIAAQHRRSPDFRKVLGAVVVPGIGLAFSSLGFGAITAFIALLFAARGWSSAWLAFTAFAGAFIFARVVFGHLPDKLGGAKVALFSIFIEAAGQGMIWLSQAPAFALTGALLTGLGYALIYPGLGIEAVRRTPPANRGLAMGTYTAFLDLALGIASPGLGLVASGAGLGAVFLVSALVILCAAAIAWRLMRTPVVIA